MDPTTHIFCRLFCDDVPYVASGGSRPLAERIDSNNKYSIQQVVNYKAKRAMSPSVS